MRKYPGLLQVHLYLRYLVPALIALTFTFCSSSRGIEAPNLKHSPEQLRKDYILFRNILEESHPSLYWFTSKDSMDYYFD